jgi:hypothetical protein
VGKDIALSYNSIHRLIQHNIDRYEEIIEKIETNTLYYVLHDTETLRDHRDLTSKLEEWQEIEELINDRLELFVYL